jgi:sialate O-acetylesterase
MRIFFPIVLLLTASFVQAEVGLPDVLGSSMVLQQKQVIPIWGTAEPGESVTVTFGKAKKTVVADANGKWRVDLGKLPANSSPETMTIVGKNTIVLKDILVGEFGWLQASRTCSDCCVRPTTATRFKQPRIIRTFAFSM